MVDYKKQKKYSDLGDYLKAKLEETYEHEMSMYQAYNANKFELRSKRPADPYIEVVFLNEEKLIVAVSDGIHEQDFFSVSNMNYVSKLNRVGDDFETEFELDLIWERVKELCYLGCRTRESFLAREKAWRIKLLDETKQPD